MNAKPFAVIIIKLDHKAIHIAYQKELLKSLKFLYDIMILFTLFMVSKNF